MEETSEANGWRLAPPVAHMEHPECARKGGRWPDGWRLFARQTDVMGRGQEGSAIVGELLRGSTVVKERCKGL